MTLELFSLSRDSYSSKNLQSTEINQDTLFFFFRVSVFLTFSFFLPFPSPPRFPPALCNHPFRAYKRILLCVVNVSSRPPCARNGERSKKGPGRNGGALCPEFVPRRSPCSFTRDDKSGVALTLCPSSRPPQPFPLPTRCFYSRLHAKLSRPHLE